MDFLFEPESSEPIEGWVRIRRKVSTKVNGKDIAREYIYDIPGNLDAAIKVMGEATCLQYLIDQYLLSPDNRARQMIRNIEEYGAPIPRRRNGKNVVLIDNA